MRRSLHLTTWTHALGVSIAALVCYLLTMVPGAYYIDSGELTAAAATLGIAHPTGYPLFSILGKIWCLLPFSSPMVAMNVFAAICTAAATGLIVYIVQSLAGLLYTKNDGANPPVQGSTSVTSLLFADIAGVLFGGSMLVWNQGTSVEVYSLNILLVAIAIATTLRSLWQPRSTARALTAAFCIALTLANHLSSAFLIPGLLCIWFAVPRGRKTPLLALLVGLMPALLYAFMWWRSSQHPIVNWGMVHRSWDAFTYHVLATQFSINFKSESAVTSENFKIFRSVASNMLLFVGWIPFLIGTTYAFRHRVWIGLGLLLMIIGNVAISVNYSIADIDSYFLPSLAVMAILAGIGLYGLTRNIRSHKAATSLAVGCLAIVLIGNVFANKNKTVFHTGNRSHHTAVQDYTTWIFSNAEPNAIILSHQWDFFVSNFWYEQLVLGKRRDAVVIDKELLRRTWYLPWLQERYPEVMTQSAKEIREYQTYLVQFEQDADAFNTNPGLTQGIQEKFVALLRSFVDNNPNRPVYITPEMIPEEQGFTTGYNMYPVGPLVRLSAAPIEYKKTRFEGLQGMASTFELYHDRLDQTLLSLSLQVLDQCGRYAAAHGDTSNVAQLVKHIERFNRLR